MYDIIAASYASIFPVAPEKVRFVASQLPAGAAGILDIGCATGELAYELSLLLEHAMITGIDPDGDMIRIANERYGSRERLKFYQKGMSDLAAADEYDLVTCLGNTLPHLEGKERLAEFIVAIHSALRKKGRFILQLLNYDRIVSENRMIFNDIERDGFIFSRRYTRITKESVSFEISLYDKLSARTFSDTVDLLPIYKKELENVLAEAGFAMLGEYGGWGMTPADGTGISRIMVWQK